MKRAFISQESGGDHNAVNSRTGALGLVQVMPENVGSFTQRYLGRAMTYAEFKNNRAAQELLVERHFELLVKHSAPGRSEEETIRRMLQNTTAVLELLSTGIALAITLQAVVTTFMATSQIWLSTP